VPWLGLARASTGRRGDLTERARILKVGGALLTLLIAGLVVGFLALDRKGGSAPPATSPTLSSPSPTDVRAQVEQGYLRAWDVWADSLLRLDPSRLSEVLTGKALQLVTAQVNAQRGKNQPVRVRAEHSYTIVLINTTQASVDDHYINHNVRLDPATLQPIEEDPNERVHRKFTMELVDGTWKIADIIEYT
jgi:hypothetical protein